MKKQKRFFKYFLYFLLIGNSFWAQAQRDPSHGDNPGARASERASERVSAKDTQSSSEKSHPGGEAGMDKPSLGREMKDSWDRTVKDCKAAAPAGVAVGALGGTEGAKIGGAAACVGGALLGAWKDVSQTKNGTPSNHKTNADATKYNARRPNFQQSQN